MFGFLKSSKPAHRPPAAQADESWQHVELPRLQGHGGGIRVTEARVMLGGLRLILSRVSPETQRSKLTAVVELERVLAGLSRRTGPEPKPQLLARVLAETSQVADPGTLHTLQRWYRHAKASEPTAFEATIMVSPSEEDLQWASQASADPFTLTHPPEVKDFSNSELTQMGIDPARSPAAPR